MKFRSENPSADIEVHRENGVIIELVEEDGNLWTIKEWENGDEPNRSFRWADEGVMVDTHNIPVRFSYIHG